MEEFFFGLAIGIADGVVLILLTQYLVRWVREKGGFDD